MVTALSPRGEDKILPSSPQEAAHLIAKLQAAFAGGTGNGIDGEHAASRFASPPGADDIAYRFAIFVSTSRSTMSAQLFGARIVGACSIIQQSRLL
jgi:hypothetical protein